MQDIVTNMRGTRAFDKRAGKMLTMALTASALSMSAIALAQPSARFSAATARALRPALTERTQSALLPSSRPIHGQEIQSLWSPLASALPSRREPEVKVADFPPFAYQAAAHKRPVLLSVPTTATPAVKPITGSGPTDVTLDFVDADIADVLKALSLQTHTNIVAGTDVKGNVTVSLAHVTLDDALSMISRLSGFQYAKDGATYVVGTPASLALLTSGSSSADLHTAVISYLYANAEDLSNVIKQIIPDIKVSSSKGAGAGAGGVFVMTGSQSDIDQARQIVQQTEAAMSKNIADDNMVVYLVKYSSPDDLETVIGRMVPNLVVTPGPSQRQAPTAPMTADSGGETSTTTSYGATPAGSPTTTATTGNIPTKPTTDSLLLSGAPADIAKAQDILAQVDVRPAQINYEARVTEVNLNDAKNFGLTYDFSGAQTTIGELLQPGETSSSNPLKVDYPGQILKSGTFGRTPISNLVTVNLNAIINDADTKTLADPNISAIDGQPAAVFIGDTVNYISSITQSPTGQNITTSSVNAGIKLFVTGKVNNDGYITLNVHPEVSLVTFQQIGVGGAQLPDITTREATTTVRVKDGATIAITGLINDQDIKNIQKVPILGDLPFFGNLFRNVNTTKQRDEVMIFLKVSIQKDGSIGAAPASVPVP